MYYSSYFKNSYSERIRRTSLSEYLNIINMHNMIYVIFANCFDK